MKPITSQLDPQAAQRHAAALLASLQRAEPGKPFAYVIAKPASGKGENVYARRILGPGNGATAILADTADSVREIVGALIALGYIVLCALFITEERCPSFEPVALRDTREAV